MPWSVRLVERHKLLVNRALCPLRERVSSHRNPSRSLCRCLPTIRLLDSGEPFDLLATSTRWGPAQAVPQRRKELLTGRG